MGGLASDLALSVTASIGFIPYVMRRRVDILRYSSRVRYPSLVPTPEYCISMVVLILRHNAFSLKLFNPSECIFALS